MEKLVYDKKFYRNQKIDNISSAEVVVELVDELFEPAWGGSSIL